MTKKPDMTSKCPVCGLPISAARKECAREKCLRKRKLQEALENYDFKPHRNFQKEVR